MTRGCFFNFSISPVFWSKLSLVRINFGLLLLGLLKPLFIKENIFVFPKFIMFSLNLIDSNESVGKTECCWKAVGQFVYHSTGSNNMEWKQKSFLKINFWELTELRKLFDLQDNNSKDHWKNYKITFLGLVNLTETQTLFKRHLEHHLISGICIFNSKIWIFSGVWTRAPNDILSLCLGLEE